MQLKRKTNKHTSAGALNDKDIIWSYSIQAVLSWMVIRISSAGGLAPQKSCETSTFCCSADAFVLQGNFFGAELIGAPLMSLLWKRSTQKKRNCFHQTASRSSPIAYWVVRRMWKVLKRYTALIWRASSRPEKDLSSFDTQPKWRCWRIANGFV